MTILRFLCRLVGFLCTMWLSVFACSALVGLVLVVPIAFIWYLHKYVFAP